MKRVLLVAAIAVLVGSGTFAQSKVDVTGKWAFNVETSGGSGTPTFTLKQDGEKLTGHYSSATLGEADVTGTVKDADITFSFTVDVQGTSINVTYTGTVDKDTMKGKRVARRHRRRHVHREASVTSTSAFVAFVVAAWCLVGSGFGRTAFARPRRRRPLQGQLRALPRRAAGAHAVARRAEGAHARGDPPRDHQRHDDDAGAAC